MVTDEKGQDKDGQHIKRLLGGLVRVAAPGDFDTRVKARIANARSGRYREASRVGYLKVAVPIAFVVIIAFGLYWGGIFSPGTANVDVAAEVPKVEPDMAEKHTTEPVQTASSGNSQNAAANSKESEGSDGPDRFIASERDRIKKVASASRRKHADTAGGSVDRALNASDTRNISNSRKPKVIHNDTAIITEGGPKLSVQGVLGLIGIEAGRAAGGLTVHSVKQGSISATAGVSVGDIVESIDGRNVDSSPQFDSKLKPKSIGILRGKERISITLTVNEK